MEVIERIIGETTPEHLANQVLLAVQGTLLIFFVLAPVAGYLFAQSIKERLRLVLAWCSAVLIVLAGNLALNLALRQVIPPQHLSDLAIAGISLVASLACAAAVIRLILDLLAPPKKPDWLRDVDEIPPDRRTIFDQRRMQHLHRDSRRR